MYLTGFADEASANIDGQIKATLELGWRNIEARNIDGANIHDLPDDAFDTVCGKLRDAGVAINCFGSAIANWGKQIDQPMDADLASIRRAIPRMKRLGTKLIRIMSYAVLKDRPPDDQMKEERFARLRTITKMFLDEGLQPVHENCMNFGGMGWSYTLTLLDNVPGLKLVFDTGNPVFTDDRTKPLPFPKQSAWEFWSVVKDHVSYIHIKDGVFRDDKTTYTYPGEGDGDVRRIVADALRSGYDGGFSIEPHLGAVFHDPTITTDDESRYATYVEYGRRMERMIAEEMKK
ncbi:MAG: sugar phosphate isomerase/epimerase [Kiritimatiellaeota bacterium]|nr:sugar phosphate isomerase/epimerase [Kiritimatiellota bacterium]